MKKWLLIALTLLLMSGCSLTKMWRWIDEMDWERDDQTIRVMRILIR
ncbi:MAG: hypothetical protein RDU20_05900 [Desulfomonilaceae bacterium]|nr:hypothetical protein [Desulfomonilaceae bacterium]